MKKEKEEKILANEIEFRLKTSADLQGVRQLKKELEEVRRVAQQGMLGENIMGGAPIKDIQATLKATNTLEHAMQSAFDPKINTINIEKFNTILNKSNMDIHQLTQSLMSAGPAGQKAFMTMTSQLMNMGTAVKQTNKVVEQMGTTLKNTVKWGISSGLWNSILSTSQQAYGYVKSLDTSLNDIRIVTGKSADEMERFGVAANEAAKNLGVSTSDFTEGALIYFQQGLDEDTSTRLAEITAKAANVTGQSMKAVSEELTAVWNGYAASAQEAELYVDRLAAIAANSASDLEELSVGMSKVASAANAMGVSEEQLASQISTIISITRQAPESVGTALKTIYARMSSIKAGAEEEGVDLMKYTKSMAEMGINVLDAKNQLRDMGDVIEEIGAKWQTMSREQQVALAQTMAGTRQYNNLIALFDNFDQYNDMMQIAANSAGTLQKQQDIYLESVAAKTEKLRTTFEDLYDSLFDEKSMSNLLEGATSAVQVMADFADAIGGLNTIIPVLGSLGLRVFKDQIGESISTTVTNISNANAQLQAQIKNEEALDNLFKSMAADKEMAQMPEFATEQLEHAKQLYKELNDLSISLNENQQKQFNSIKDSIIETGKLSMDYQDMVLEIKDISKVYPEIIDSTELELKNEEQINDLLTKQVDNILKYSNIKSGLGDINLKTTDMSNAFEQFKDKSYFDHLNTEALKADGATQKTIKGIQGIEQALYNAAKAGQNLDEVFNNKTLDNLNKANTKFFRDNKESVEIVKQTLNEYKAILQGVEGNVQEFSTALQQSDNEFLSEEKTVNDLTQRFRELSLEQKNTDEIFKIISEDFQDLINKSQGAEEGLRLIQQRMETGSKAAKNYVESISLQNVISSVSNVAGAIGQLTMSISMLKDVGSIWFDEDATIGEKIEKTVMSLSMAIPMLASAYSTLTTKKDLDTIATWLNTAAIEANSKAEGENAITKSASAASEGLENVTKTGNTLFNVFTQGGKKLFTFLIGGIEKIATSLGLVGGIIAAVTVAAGIAYSAYKNYRKEQIALANESAAAAQKEYDQTKENLDQVKELTDAYEQLESQRDSMPIEDYKDSLFRLCEQYGLEHEALMTIAGDYKAVEDAIKSKMKVAEEEAAKTAESNLGAQNAALDTAIRNTATASQISEDTLDFHSGPGDMSSELQGILRKFDIEAVDFNSKIDIKSLKNALSNYGNEIISALNEGEEKDTKELQDFLIKLSNNIEGVYNANQTAKEYIYTNTIEKAKLNDVTSGKDLSEKITKEASNIHKQDPSITIEEAKSNLYAALDDVSSDTVLKAKIIDFVLESYGEGAEEVAKQIENKSSEELQTIIAGLEYGHAFADGYEDIIEKASKANIGMVNQLTNQIDAIKSVMTDIKNDTFSKEQLATLFDSGIDDFLSEKGISFELFSASDFQTQYKLVSEFYNSILDKSEETKVKLEEDVDDVKKSADEMTQKFSETFWNGGYETQILDENGEWKTQFISNIEEAEKAIESLNPTIEKMGGVFEEKINGMFLELESGPINLLDEGFESSEEAIDAYTQYLQGNLNDLSASQKRLFKEFSSENFNIDSKTITSWILLNNKVKEYYNKIKEINNVQGIFETGVEAASSAIENYTESINYATQNFKNNMTAIDNLQSAYGSLSSAIEDYNEKGYMTLDNVQALLSLDPKYLAALDMEGNTLSVNTDLLKQMVLAQLDEAEANLYAEYTEELKAIAMGKSVEAARQGTAADAARQASMLQTGQTALTAAGMIDEYNKTLAQASTFDPTTTKAVDEDFQKRLALIQKAREGINSNFAGAMKSGGKSGGGSKQNKEKQKYELDAYKQLERAIDSLNKKLDGLKERQEHLSGKKLVKNIEAQTKAYVKQAAAIQQLNQAAQVEVATQKKNIADQGYNLKYDKSGNITQKSYNKAYDDEWKRYNAAIDTYNKSAKDETAEKALKAAKDRYDQFKEYVDKYNTAKAKAEDTLNQLMEAIQQVADSNLAKFNVEFDAKLNTQEAERSWLKFQQKYKKDFKKVAKHTAQDIKDIYDEASSYKNSFDTEEERFKGIENQYNKMLDIYKDFTDKNGAVSSDNVEVLTKEMQKAGVTFTTVADMQKALQESFDNLQEYAENVYDALVEGWQNYIESIDEVIDHMDELMETYDKLTDKNEYYLKVAELTAGVYNKQKSAADQLKEAQRQYYDTTIKNSESKLRAINNEEAAYKRMLQTIVDKHTAEGKTIEEIKLMEDYIKVANKLNTLEKDKQQTVLDTIQAGIDKRNMERQEAYDALESSLAGSKYKNFKEMNEEWDKVMKNQERYYDSTEKLYQLESLANKYQSAIDKEGMTLANQDKLNKLKEKELKYLKEKEKLTKDDIALAEQRYNIAMAEMALEEAQNSKNEMKVVRNAEGNWSYQYVANEEDVADKKQDLLDQYNELYEMSKKAFQDSLELAMQAKEEFLEKYKEIVEDASLTDSQRQEKLNKLAEDYKDLINQYYEEADAFQIDLYASSAVIIKDYYDGNIEELKTATEQEQEIYKAATENNISNYDAYRDEVLDGTSIIAQAEEKFTENSIHLTQDIENEKRQLEKTMTVDMIDAYNKITSAEEEYGRTCDTVSGLVNEHWDKIAEAIKKTEEEGVQAENSIKEYGEEANNQIEEELESLRELENLWNSVQKAIESCKNAMDDLMQAAEDGITAVKQAAETARNVGNQATNTAASSAGAGGGSTTSGPKATQSATHNGQWQVTYDYGNRKETKTYTNYEDQKKDMQARNAHFLSGGYTGSWTNGSEEDNGRLAMLHQKELVLNKDDTSNFLEAINTVRDIASLSTSVGNVIVDKIAEMIGRMVGTNINKINNVSNNDNSSNVVYNINAEFPNATDKNSIIAAFESLPNITSQKVNAKFR